MNTQDVLIEAVEQIEAVEAEETTETTLHIQTGVKAGYSAWDAFNPAVMYDNMARALGY